MPNTKCTIKNCQRLARFCQSGRISLNMVTLPLKYISLICLIDVKRFISVDYKRAFSTGTVFDSTYDSGRQPLEIEIGASGIKGWDQALTGACKGEKRTVFVPSELAYGEKG